MRVTVPAAFLLLYLFPLSVAHCDENVSRFKNLHYLGKLPEQEFFRTMNFMRGSLGVHCDFCHVVGKDGWKWELDDKPAKNRARQMIGMVLEINHANFKDEPVVTCFTCHQGSIRPNNMPPLPQAAPPFPTAIPESDVVDMPAQQIIDRYLQATGGESRTAITNADTIVFKGTTDETWQRKVVPIEAMYKAPDKWLITIHKKDTPLIEGCNGAACWTTDGAKTTRVTLSEAKSLQETLDALRVFPVLPSSSPVRVRKLKINDRDSYAIEYKIADDVMEQYCFDAESSLLVRKSRFTRSPIGIIPEEINYLDYKPLRGANVPCTLRSNYVDPWIGGTRTFSEILVNARVDDSSFRVPE